MQILNLTESQIAALRKAGVIPFKGNIRLGLDKDRAKFPQRLAYETVLNFG